MSESPRTRRVFRSEDGPGWLLPTLLFAAFLPAFCSTAVQAAEAIVTPPDTNSWVVIENALARDEGTTLFFMTRPDIRDPEARNPCALNYYSVKLGPGLQESRPAAVAKGVCGGVFQKSRLLDNGDALIIVRDRLERWRGGKQISSERFASMDAVRKLGVDTDMGGGQFYAIAPNGNVVIAVQSGSASQDGAEYGGVPLVVTGLRPNGSRRWEVRFDPEGMGNNVQQVWAGSDGSALLHTGFLPGGMSLETEERLYFVRPDGSKEKIVLNRIGETVDFQNMTALSQEEVMQLLQQQGQANPESIEKLSAVARDHGGFDVLFQRTGGGEGREGFFLYRLAPDGAVEAEISLGEQIELHGLERWFDFYVAGEQLVLMSKAPVTQKVVRGVKKGWGQIIVSRIDLASGTPTSRVIPLDERYLEAAMNAGDEGQQYLEGQPGSDPVLLTVLAGKPLTVSVGWINKRQVVRLHEADESLPLFTEVADERRAELAREAAREQRRADRDARSQRMPVAEAEAAGTPQDMSAQIAAAMAEAQQQMANDPNMTPEMRAQMQAVLSQMGKGFGGQIPGMPATAVNEPVTPPENALKVDAGKRGFVKFENPEGRPTTLLIFDRKSGRELLEKDYPDGVIYEYVDFSRYGLPLEQIGVLYREAGGTVLEDLTPVIAR